MDKVAGSGNDEFYTPPYAVLPLLKYIEKGKTVWCPFDTEHSWFVRILSKYGCRVVFSHIDLNADFFHIRMKCDYIISNPPYSKKKCKYFKDYLT